MILTLLPSVAVLAQQTILASILIFPVFVLVSVPVRALNIGVRVLIRLSSEVLPVVCKHTYFSSMIVLVVRAPCCFKVEHVKVSILLELVNEIN